MSLKFTGERFLPECAGEMVYEHWHRYLLARQYVTGLRVLDVASGEGYGSHLLSAAASEVVGVDVSAAAVAHADQRYRGGKLRFVEASCTQIPEPDASFDVIVSFETIEHITEHQAFLLEVDRLLKPDGLFLISSPNRPEYSDATGYKNEFHVKELDREELRALLAPHFVAQRWFAQRAAFHSLVWPIDETAQSAAALSVDGEPGYPAEMYFVVFCARSAGRLTNIDAQLSLVADRELSVYSEWSRTYRENTLLHEEIRTLRAAIATSSEPQSASVPAEEPALVRWAKKITGSR